MSLRANNAGAILRDGFVVIEGVLSPAEVAAACGFCDQSHLTRVFKARRGVTPAVFARSRVRSLRAS